LGMLAGLGVTVGLGMFFGAILAAQNIKGLHLNYLEGSYFGGALGAMVSVMTRMTRNKLDLNYESGPKTLFVLGVFRPAIGTIFGLFAYFVLVSGLLHVNAPSNGDSNFYFYGAIAFVAGFSERFAPDMISRVDGGSDGQE
jgi:hypothetical protein